MPLEMVGVKLPHKLIEAIDESVRSGEFESRSDAVRSAIIAYYGEAAESG